MSGENNKKEARNQEPIPLSATERRTKVDIMPEKNKGMVEILNDKIREGNSFSEYPQVKSLTDGEGFCLNEYKTDLERYNGAKACVEIPKGINVIKEKAFYGCNKIDVIVIPDTVGFIEDNAFKGCPALLLCLHKDKPQAWSEGWNCELDYRFDIESQIKKS